jgi:predicted nuclease with RNAse H fold
MHPTRQSTLMLRRLEGAVARVAGLDLAAGRGRSALAVVEVERGDEAPSWRRMAEASPLVTDAEIVAALAQQQPVVLAIDAPLSLPERVANALGIPTTDAPLSLPERVANALGTPLPWQPTRQA